MAQIGFTAVVAANTSGSAFVNLHNLKFAAVRSLESGNTPPASPPAGCLWYDQRTSSVPVTRQWDGSQWVAIFAVENATHRPRFVMDADRDTYFTMGSDGEVLFVSEGVVAAVFDSTGISVGDSAARGAGDFGAKTDGLYLPKGTTEQAGSADAGKTRWNSTAARMTVGDGSTHKTVAYTDDTFTPADDSVGTDQLKVSGFGQLNQVFSSDGDGTASWRDLPPSVSRGTLRSTASGTVVEWTDLPPNVVVMRLLIDRVSLNGSDNLILQLGTASNYEQSGYASYSKHATFNAVNSTAGLIIDIGNPSEIETGQMDISSITGNEWIASHGVGYVLGRGRKSLAGTLTRVRLKPTGSNSFDGGQANLLWWTG